MVGRLADIQIMEERGAPLLGKAGGSSENFVWKRKKRKKQKESWKERKKERREERKKERKKERKRERKKEK